MTIKDQQEMLRSAIEAIFPQLTFRRSFADSAGNPTWEIVERPYNGHFNSFMRCSIDGGDLRVFVRTERRTVRYVPVRWTPARVRRVLRQAQRVLLRDFAYEADMIHKHSLRFV